MDWTILKIENGSFVLGIEERNEWLKRWHPNDTIAIGDKELYVNEVEVHGNDYKVIFGSSDDSGLNITNEKAVEYNGGYIKVWKINAWLFGGIGANVSVFSEYIDLGKSEDVIFEWSESYSYDPRLKSIFIPGNSTVFSAIQLLGYENEILQDAYHGQSYKQITRENKSGIIIEFEPALPKYAIDPELEDPWDRLDNVGMEIKIKGKNWRIITIDKDSFIVGIKSSSGWGGSQEGKDEEHIVIGNESYSLIGINSGRDLAKFYSEKETVIWPGYQLIEYNSTYFKLEYLSLVYDGRPRAQIVQFSEVLDLSNYSKWDNEDPINPKLKSIIIPKNTSAFTQLTAS